MVVSARYRSGVLLSYSLVAYSPWEGLRVAITGDKGRVELYERHGAHVIEQTPTGTEGPDSPGAGPQRQILLFPMFQGPVEVESRRAGAPTAGTGTCWSNCSAPSPRPTAGDGGPPTSMVRRRSCSARRPTGR